MTDSTADHQLVREFAAQASERAFEALVNRHVDLVFATAQRQLGDRTMAEEVTQNVFVVLARKAPRLAGVQTLAGWLHRTTILEAKARIRGELRRRRREEHAGDLLALQKDGASALAPLVPLLDEGLLHLRDHDRLALILRYLEERSLREVGTALGVDEDAAGKRVERALDRLTEFFRRHGFAIPAGTGAVAVLAGSAQAAPAGLAASVAQAGFAASGTVTGFSVLITHVMALTKIQTAALCVLVAAVPLVWQRQTQARTDRETTRLHTALMATARQANEIEAEAQRTGEGARWAEVDALNLGHQLAALNARRDGSQPRPAYRWDDAAPVMRVPKEVVEQLSVDAIHNKRGQLGEQIKEILQMTETEANRVQDAVDQFLGKYDAARAEKIRIVPPLSTELNGRQPEDVRVFEVPELEAQVRDLRQELFSELEAILDPERFPLFRKALRDWMPLDDKPQGLNSSMAVFGFAHRELFYRPKPGDRGLQWRFSAANNVLEVPTAPEEIPGVLRSQLQDWLALLQPELPQP